MPIKVNISPRRSIDVEVSVKPEPVSITLELDIRKSLNGDLMIFDHGDIDIVLSGKNQKVTAFPKQTMTEFTYGAQNRLFNHLSKKGIILSESIQGGSYYGAMECSLQVPSDEKHNAAKFALLAIESFVEEERPYFENKEAQIAGFEDEMTNPDKEYSTELGDVPHATEKGSIRPGVRSFGTQYMYTM